jgi:hypothetical protein
VSSANRRSTPAAIDTDQLEGRYAPLGGYTVGFETFKQDVDPAPLFAGLPGDRCSSPHWGMVVTGRLTLRWADHDETYLAGDAYYAAPGQLPLATAGTSVVEFSPTANLRPVMAVLDTNMRAAGVQA